jgi:hypothetical protein
MEKFFHFGKLLITQFSFRKFFPIPKIITDTVFQHIPPTWQNLLVYF